MSAHDVDGVAATVSCRLLIVSDILLYREGVAHGLKQIDGFTIAGTGDGGTALRMLDLLATDAVLLDAALPDALALAAAVRLRAPDVPVVGFGVGEDEAAALACIEAGLVGFVGRDATIGELAATVRRAVAGEVRCSPRLVARLCARVATLSHPRPAANDAPLTQREGQVATLIAQGLSNKEIALALGIGPATVKNHVHNILEKLHVARRGAIGVRLPPTLRTGTCD